MTDRSQDDPDGLNALIWTTPDPAKPDEHWGWHLHHGVRFAVLKDFPEGHPACGKLVISMVGGKAAEPGCEEDGIAIALSPGGLRALALDMLAAADLFLSPGTAALNARHDAAVRTVRETAAALLQPCP